MKKMLGGLLVALVLVQFTVVNVFGAEWGFPGPMFSDLDEAEIREIEAKIHSFMFVKTVVSVVNTVLMSYLLWFYYSMYREKGSTFLIGLIALSFAMLLYSLSSNPWLLYNLSRKSFRLLGVFTSIPDLFATIAALILIYLART